MCFGENNLGNMIVKTKNDYKSWHSIKTFRLDNTTYYMKH